MRARGPLSLLALVTTLAIGCGGIHVYRHLNEGDAMKTCNANKVYRAEGHGSDEKAARHDLEEKAKAIVKQNGGCGLLIFNEAYSVKEGKDYGDFQLCECK